MSLPSTPAANDSSHLSVRAAPVRVMVFTRDPQPGSTKTRLIPAIGPEWAAELQRRMTMHVLQVCSDWAGESGSSLEVWTAESNPAGARRTFGGQREYLAQCTGDLGARLIGAFDHRGGPAIALGADCVEIDSKILTEATNLLRESDLVIGPANDGGYYLIAMKTCHRQLFLDMPWGTDAVLEETLRRAHRLELSVKQLTTLTDIDSIQDLPAWHRRCETTSKAPRISVIIPTLNESASLDETIHSIGSMEHVEVVVADGGSTDTTRERANELGASVVPTPTGRSVQLNCGAALARADVLLFLHADTKLPHDWLAGVSEWRKSGAIAAAFRLRFDATSRSMSIIAVGANWRARCRQMPYGDQGLLMHRTTFGELDGYRALDVMEDYDMARRLRQRGRIHLLPQQVTTSARRYLTNGPWRTVLKHQMLIAKWHVGRDV